MGIGGPVGERPGPAVEDGHELPVVVGVGPARAVAEGDAVGDLQGHLGAAVVVEVVDGDAVVVAHVDGGGAGFDVVLVGAVGPQVDFPEEGAVALVGLDRLRRGLPVDHVVVLAVAVEVAGPGELHGAAVAQRDADHRFFGVVGAQGERRARGLLCAACDRGDAVGVGLREVRGRVGVVGARGEDLAVELRPRAAPGGAVDVEAGAGRVEPEQAPAHEHARAAGPHGDDAAAEVLHRADGLLRLDLVLFRVRGRGAHGEARRGGQEADDGSCDPSSRIAHSRKRFHDCSKYAGWNGSRSGPVSPSRQAVRPRRSL